MAVVNEPAATPLGLNPNDLATYSTQILQPAMIGPDIQANMMTSRGKSAHTSGGTLLLACVSCIAPEVNDMAQSVISPIGLDDGTPLSSEEKPIPTTRTDANFQISLASTQASIIFEVRAAGSPIGENVVGRFALKPSSVKNTIDHRAAG